VGTALESALMDLLLLLSILLALLISTVVMIALRYAKHGEKKYIEDYVKRKQSELDELLVKVSEK
jgi:hypothetical protein